MSGTMFHPWRELRRLHFVRLHWQVMQGTLGETNGIDLVWMHPHQGQAQRRSTMAHELAHIELEHTSGCNGLDESAATLLAARWLIPLPALIDALRWSRSVDEAAEELWVDVTTVRVRLLRLTAAEHQSITEAGVNLPVRAPD